MFNHFSLQKFIQYKLREVLILREQKYVNKFIDLNTIIVEIFNQKYQKEIGYKSPFCLQIAKIEKQNPQDIAQDFVNLWSNFLDLQVNISSNGWLEFILGDRFLSFWLQELPKINLPNLSENLSQNNLDFKLLYTHARCCSLLRSAHRDQLIQLKNIDFSKGIWLWNKPNFIPYDCCLNFEYEKNLIRQLIIIVDAIYIMIPPTPLINNYKYTAFIKLNWLKLTDDFSEVILDFERNCRIWGEIKRQNLSLSQARLGLIALAQFFLQWLLEKQLGAIAPFEL